MGTVRLKGHVHTIARQPASPPAPRRRLSNSTAVALPPRPTEVQPLAYARACACMAVAMARGARKDRAAQAAACTAREALAPSSRLQKGGRARMRARVQFRVLALGLVYTKVVTYRPQK